MKNIVNVGLSRVTDIEVDPVGKHGSGVACLAALATYHDKSVTRAELQLSWTASASISSLQAFTYAAAKIGFLTNVLAGNSFSNELRNIRLPAVAVFNDGHFAIVTRLCRGKVHIVDPCGDSGYRKLTTFFGDFSGTIIEVSPAMKFSDPQPKRRVHLREMWRGIRGFSQSVSQLIALSIFMQAFVLLAPYYQQLAIDKVIPSLDIGFMTVLALGFAIFAVFNVVANLLRSFVVLHFGSALSYDMSMNLVNHLFRLPIRWFADRDIGDVLSRLQSVGPIQSFLTQGAISTLLDGSLILLTLAMMFIYSSKLAAISLAAFLLYLVIRLSTLPIQRRFQNRLIESASSEQSVMIDTLRGITTLRVYNKERERHNIWKRHLATTLNRSASMSRLSSWQFAGNMLIFSLENILVIWVAIKLIIDGDFTVGMIFAFLAYKSQFVQRSSSLIDQIVAYKMLDLHLERLSDVVLEPEDVAFSGPAIAPCQFLGQIELQNAGFSYPGQSAAIFTGLNLHIARGDFVAITGASGCGKSTLLKVLTGVLRLESGNFLVEGVPISRFGYRHFQGCLGVVMQDDHLFSGSIRDNITLFDSYCVESNLHEAAQRAAIHDEVLTMTHGYDTLIGDMGSALSGGQRQRVLLARALYRSPTLLIMDEGTSQLDPVNEALVNAATKKMGITRLIVAHRRDTIAAASRWLRLEGGKLIELSSAEEALTSPMLKPE